MLQVKLEADWGGSSSEDEGCDTRSAELANDDQDDDHASFDVAADVDNDNLAAHIVADPSGESRPSNICGQALLPKTRSLNIKSAKGSVGLVSGNRAVTTSRRAPQPSSISRNELLPKKRILNMEAAVSLLRRNKSFRAVATSTPPAMAPPPPPRIHRGQINKHQPAKPNFDLSSAWHFDGRRVWSWMHDGVTENGYIELCENGYLCTDLCSSGEGSWTRQPGSDNVLVTFGKCSHLLELQITRPSNTPLEYSFEPTFIVRKRTMVNGQPVRDKRPVRTRGRLLCRP